MLTESIVFFDSSKSGYYFILFCFVDKVVQALFKFFGSFFCCLDVGDADAFVCIGELLIVIPYGFVFFQSVDDAMGENKRG